MKRSNSNPAGLYLAWRNPRKVKRPRAKRQVTPGYAFALKIRAFQEEMERRRLG